MSIFDKGDVEKMDIKTKYKQGEYEKELNERLKEYLKTCKSTKRINTCSTANKFRQDLMLEQQRREENIRQVRSLIEKK